MRSASCVYDRDIGISPEPSHVVDWCVNAFLEVLNKPTVACLVEEGFRSLRRASWWINSILYHVQSKSKGRYCGVVKDLRGRYLEREIDR